MSIENYSSEGNCYNFNCNNYNLLVHPSGKTTLDSKKSAEIILCLANMIQTYLTATLTSEELINDGS
jgi:hypothetical protein